MQNVKTIEVEIKLRPHIHGNINSWQIKDSSST